MSVGQDWWRWDADESVWRAIRTDLAVTEPEDPDPEDPFDPDEPDPPPSPEPDPSGRNVLLVTSAGGLSTGNQALHDILVADGWTVTVRAFDAEEDYTDMSVVVLTTGPTSDSGRYTFPPVGIVAVDCWRAVGMGTQIGWENLVNDVEVSDPASPLAAGQSGTFNAYLSPQFITWEPDNHPGLQTAVTRAGQPTRRVIFAYEAGTVMPGRYAQTRHVGIGYHANGFAAGLTSAARAQVLAAVRWARDTQVVPPDVPAIPTNLTASPEDGRVRLAWNAAARAETYVPRRALVTGGPYTTLANDVTALTYTDTAVTNDTEYFYVVAARNLAGTSGNSNEASATPAAAAPTDNLSMLVASNEIALWQQRAANGPFRVAGDFSSNSPGHWSEMQSDASANWSSARWSGPPELNSDGSVARLGQTSGRTANDPPGETMRMGYRMKGAAYVAVTTNDAQMARNILAEIRWHSQQSRLNFANKTLYPDNHFNDLNPLFMICLWMSSLILAYDACTAIVDKDEGIENWLTGLAGAAHGNLLSLTTSLFPNRGSDSYTSRATWVDDRVGYQSRLSNGDTVGNMHVGLWYNNRRMDMAAVQGLVGVLTNNSFHLEWSKRFVREWVMFANNLNHWTNSDFHRGSDSNPQQGVNYDLNSLARLVYFMEALARSGDTSLYDFSSSEGANHPTWGTNHQKSMKQVLQQRIDMVKGTITARYTGTGNPPSASVAGDEFYRVRTRASDQNREIVPDGVLLMPAAYYNEPDWVPAVMRQGTLTGFTSTPRTTGALGGWMLDYRTRFLRSVDASPWS